MAIYLDNNATTPMDERVLEAMMPYFRDHFGNASSVHSRGRVARQAVETAREQVARLVNARPAQVIFTSGGTEANNFALRSVRHLATGPYRVAVSAVEHPSVLEPAKQWGETGIIPVDEQGRVGQRDMRLALANTPQLVSVMTANNETGVLQDIPSLAALAREQGVLFHTDAVQAAGKVALDFDRLGVHLLTLSGHKLYGPKGVGALIVDSQLDIEPLLVGGGQERGRRSGTENVAAIVGFGLAAELAADELAARSAHVQRLRERFENALQSMTDVVLFGQQAGRLPNTVLMAIPGIDGETLLMALDRAGIEVSSGSACDSQKSRASHVLLAMGVEAEIARCAVRISLGKENTTDDIDQLVSVLKQQIQMLRSLSSLAWA